MYSTHPVQQGKSYVYIGLRAEIPIQPPLINQSSFRDIHHPYLHILHKHAQDHYQYHYQYRHAVMLPPLLVVEFTFLGSFLFCPVSD
jgi:hypothetical protein